VRAATISLIFVGLSLAASGASAQGFWAKKPWQKWSKDECQKMLSDSPWGQTWSTQTTVLPVMGQSSNGTGREEDPTVYYFVELRSALPMREALGREAQLENNYDKSDPQRKKAIDDSVNAFLSRPFDDIVVHLDYDSNVEIYQRQVMQYWQSFAPGVVPEQTYLINARGQKLVPGQMIVAPGGQNGVEFKFPRAVNGHPFIQPGDKSFSFQFVSPTIGPLQSQNAFVVFSTKKMKLNGQLVN
jgi:hypothetical protein